MKVIQHALCVRDVMNCCNRPVLYSEVLVDDANNGCYAVRGAGCRTDNMVLLRVIEMVINANDDIAHSLFDRCRNHYLRHTLLQIRL